MQGEFWINLPVKDVGKASEFFTRLGFSVDSEYSSANEGAKFVVGSQKIVVWLYAESVFKNYAKSEISDAMQTAEVLFSLYVDSRAEVDELAKNALNAGGTVFSEPEEFFDWLYGCGFADLDGHRWNVMFRNESKMPQKK